MTLQLLAPKVFAIPLGFVNVFLIDDHGLTLIDTGIGSSGKKILQAIEEMGRKPTDVKRILVTHLHGDHTGSLAEIKRQTGAPVWMHSADAALVRQGKAMRPSKPAPGLVNQTLVRAFMSLRGESHIEPVEIEYELEDGQEVEGMSGIRAVHTPGHTAGHLAFLWQRDGGALFVGDAAAHMRSLQLSMIYEDIAEGQLSLKKIASLPFETACFSHGKSIPRGASAAFQEQWG
jgi:glyoxylase-like metal-dependent hydrolase (beta-lactamase superfamily II)